MDPYAGNGSLEMMCSDYVTSDIFAGASSVYLWEKGVATVVQECRLLFVECCLLTISFCQFHHISSVVCAAIHNILFLVFNI